MMNLKKYGMRHAFLSFLFGLLIFILVRCAALREDKKYNVLFISIDDLKPTLGTYGDSTTYTPHMDRLAEQSVVFLNNHCQQAVCGPSRASLLTGLYPDQIQVWGFERHIRDVDFEVITLPQHFKNEGYYTIGISKIFDFRNVDAYRDSLSWSELAFPLEEKDVVPYMAEESGELAGYFYQSPIVKKVQEELIRKHPEIQSNPQPYLHKQIKPACECLDLPDHAYKDGVFTNKAMSDLERLSQSDQPFFLAVGFERPHLPYTAPKKYWDLYNRDKIQLAEFQGRAENDVDYAYTNSGSIKSYSDEQGNFIYKKLGKGEYLSEDEQRKLIHGYKASASYIDAQVGKLLDKLKELGLEENTIVVLWGDHGYHLYDHGMWGKSTNFEQGTRSPMMISMPGIKPHKTNVPTEFIDIFPTLCEMTGVKTLPHLSGESLVPLMNGDTSSVKGYAISQFQRDNKMGYALRTKRYRYVEWINDGRHINPVSDLKDFAAAQLFDYQVDPMETKNLYHVQAYAEIQKELADKLHGFLMEQVIEWEEP